MTMKSTLIGCMAAVTLGIGAASAAQPSTDNAPAATMTPAATAQPSTDKTPTTAMKPAAAAQSKTDKTSTGAVSATSGAAMKEGEAFITQQAAGTLRAPKLIGVAVYDSQNKSVGKIADLLLDHDGSVKAVVIGIGGFLGMGAKDVAVPYSEIRWQTEPRKVEVSQPAAAAPAAGGMAAKPEVKTIPPADTEAYQGYPDKAVLNMTQAQLKSAPDFHYAQDPSTKVGADATGGAAPAPKQ